MTLIRSTSLLLCTVVRSFSCTTALLPITETLNVNCLFGYPESASMIIIQFAKLVLFSRFTN